MNTRKSQSNKIIKMDRLAQSCPKISKRELLTDKATPTKATGVSCPLPFSKDTTPRIDIDSLAQQWCQLLMDQVQEERSRKTLRSAFRE